jgi:glycosyltransferase involved in cell wall biosynthesis
MKQKIDIAVAGKFHAFSLASKLAEHSSLGDLYAAHRSLNPPKHVAREQYHNRFDLALWGALSRFGPVGYTHEHKNRLFGDWLADKLVRKSPRVLHSWNGNSYKSFKLLKDTGWRLCVERSCPHNQYQYDILVEEGKALDVAYSQDQVALEHAIEELYLADIIVAPSHYSANSYVDPELRQKVRINPLGSNVAYLDRTVKKPSLRVLMVGNDFLRKGTHYLVEAFKLIRDPRAELWIRGDVPESYQRRINDPRITVMPPVLPNRLKDLYQAADVFVQPSIDEGFGMTVLEALGYGLPLVVTSNVGARELLSEQVAVTVPIRDPTAIAHAIERAIHLPGPAFDGARRTIIEQNSWDICVRRMINTVYNDEVDFLGSR